MIVTSQLETSRALRELLSSSGVQEVNRFLPLQSGRTFCTLPRPAVKFNTTRCVARTKEITVSFPIRLQFQISIYGELFLGTMKKGNQSVHIYRFSAKNVKFLFCFIISEARITCVGYLGKSPERLLIKSSFASIQKQFGFC